MAPTGTVAPRRAVDHRQPSVVGCLALAAARYRRRSHGRRERDATSAIRTELAADLSRRDFIGRAGGLGLGALVLGALPIAERMTRPATASAAAPGPTDATLQAF